MAFYRVQERTCNEYIYLVQSYRDDEGKVKQNTTYLGTKDNILFSPMGKCTECGTSEKLYSDLCADCFLKSDKGPITRKKNQRYGFYNWSKGSNYVMAEFASGEGDVREKLYYFDKVREGDEYIHLVIAWKNTVSFRKDELPNYVLKTLQSLVE